MKGKPLCEVGFFDNVSHLLQVCTREKGHKEKNHREIRIGPWRRSKWRRAETDQKYFETYGVASPKHQGRI